MTNIKSLKVLQLISTIVIFILVFSINSFAGSKNYVFTTCSADGTIKVNDKQFTQATIKVTNIDTSGNYIYCGADVGIFEKPISGNNWSALFNKRVITSDTEIVISEFSDISKYKDNQTYILEYRALYRSIGVDGDIIEGPWQTTPNGYFRISAYTDVVFTTCDVNGNVRTTDKQFAKATINVSNIDTSGNYIYCGADVGVFIKTVFGSDWSSLFNKRIITNEQNIVINDFNDISKYKLNQVYVLGYKALYHGVGNDGGIIEGPWQTAPDSYFKLIASYTKIQHTQVVTYNFNRTRKSIEVADPYQTGLVEPELSEFKNSSIFVNGDILVYRFKFNAPKANSSDIGLQFNSNLESGVKLSLLSASINGTSINVSGSKQSDNCYLLNINNAQLKHGENYLEYKVLLKVYPNSDTSADIKNVATITSKDIYNNVITFVPGAGSNDSVITRIYKGNVIYR